MSENVGDQYTIHLSELDEHLAQRLIDTKAPIRFSIIKNDLQGNIAIRQISSENTIEEGGIDFELSPSEYQSLDTINITDFTNRSVYTSSAYEFFDFILMYFSDLVCIVDFNGNSWRIRIIKYSEGQAST